jgi:hypothetical protein
VIRNRNRWAPLLAIGALALGACDVEPYCFTCRDHLLDSGFDANSADMGVDAHDAGRDTNPVDAGTDAGPVDANDVDGCVPGAASLQTDPNNCGTCGHVCSFPHAFAMCTAGTCHMGMCLAGYVDHDNMPANGCELHCLATGAEVCDLRDNDCDAIVDEGFNLQTDVMNCGMCGESCSAPHATSGCTAGVCTISSCATGFYDINGNAIDGCEYSCTPSGAEVCDRVDNNCDGHIDEGDPGGGGTCGSSVGDCRTGVNHCVGGTISCVGNTGPVAEICDGHDNDCDGTVDNGNPGGGLACGMSTGACVQGHQMCTSGTLQCIGAVGPVAETCNGIDDDCDGTVDNGNPGGGGVCGSNVGHCSQGTLTCSGATIVCMGAVLPSLEICNGIDDDCDGVVDNGYDLQNDITNCGMCNHVCSYTHGIAACTAGVCSMAACAPGYIDLDHMASTGCEYQCTPTSSTETCNGVDDNCNGMIDEGVVAPSNYCFPNGVCAGTVPTCMGASQWVCTYPATYQITETRCDGLDNDCNGIIDDPYRAPTGTLGQTCTNGGVGSCFHAGTYVCNSTHDGVTCNAAAGTVGTETCNAADDDCDGTVDEGTSTWAQVRPSGGTGSTDYWIMSYEASHPSASSTSQGTNTASVCSVANVLPWTGVTPAAAATACASIGATLCTETQWQAACDTTRVAACTWSYSTMCNTYQANACNGQDYDSDPTMGGNQDSLVPTGHLASCEWTTDASVSPSLPPPQAGIVYDMSGNAQEWTAPRSAGANPIRGGSYNDIPGGLTCDFNFDVEADGVSLPDTGFRCCRTTAPPGP